jgi:hypothetical protein
VSAYERNADYADEVLVDSPASQSRDVLGRLRMNYQSLDYYVDLLSRLILTCLEHEKCGQKMSGEPLPAQGSGMLPSRCLELRDHRVFLVETRGVTGRFVTLSHRWTDETFNTRTTAANYEERLTGQWDCTLPKVYIDVLKLAQRLDVKYVWIDSLCITQAGDGGQDWEVESKKMAPYYQGSLITVMATSSTSEAGLYPEQLHIPTARELVRLPYRNCEGQVQGHFFVYRNALSGADQFKAEVLSSALLSRGWVFQEYHLSRRSVCFTGQGMFFTCETNGSINGRGEFAPLQSTSCTNAWYESYMSQYSGLFLTRPHEDRLRALHGIMMEYLVSTAIDRPPLQSQREPFFPSLRSNTVQELTPRSRSIDAEARFWEWSGLWMFNLHAGLAWQLNTDSSSTPQQYPNYPTWSWASTAAPVSWEGLVSDATVVFKNPSLLDCNGNNVTSEDDPANMQERLPVALAADGYVVSVLVRRHFEDEKEIRIISRLTESSKAVGTEEDVRSANWRKVCFPNNSSAVAGWASIEHPEFQRDAAFVQNPPIHALVLTHETSSIPPYVLGHFFKKAEVYTVLYLRKVSSEEKYERIGVGKLFGEDATLAFNKGEQKRFVLL